MSDALQLADLIAARLCHDIGGPIGTLAGTLELASAEQVAQAEAVATVNEAARDLTRRVRLLRFAWSAEATPMDVARLEDLAIGAPGADDVRLDVTALRRETVFPAAMARILLNVVLLAAESLPRGGTLALADAGDGQVLATLTGPRAAWPPDLAAVIADEAAAWAALAEPRTLLAPLTALLARRAGIRLSLPMPTGTQRRRRPPLLIAPAPGSA